MITLISLGILASITSLFLYYKNKATKLEFNNKELEGINKGVNYEKEAFKDRAEIENSNIDQSDSATRERMRLKKYDRTR